MRAGEKRVAGTQSRLRTELARAAVRWLLSGTEEPASGSEPYREPFRRPERRDGLNALRIGTAVATLIASTVVHAEEPRWQVRDGIARTHAVETSDGNQARLEVRCEPEPVVRLVHDRLGAVLEDLHDRRPRWHRTIRITGGWGWTSAGPITTAKSLTGGGAQRQRAVSAPATANGSRASSRAAGRGTSGHIRKPGRQSTCGST